MPADPQEWLIYGATGFTGSRIAEAAEARGLAPRLCARDGVRLGELAHRLGLSGMVARLDRPNQLRAAAHGCRLVLNAAGPFSRTTPALLALCLEQGMHYLDVSGEVGSIQHVCEAHGHALSARVMLMPAVGFDVVASDCLALHAARRLSRPETVRIGFAGLGAPSRGSAHTIVQESHTGIRVRSRGALRCVPAGSLEHSFDFGAGPRRAVAVSWGDCVTSFYSTGASNIETYMEATPQMRFALAFQPVSRLFAGGLAEYALATALTLTPARVRSSVVVAEVVGQDGMVARSRLVAPNVYDVTIESSVSIVARALAGDIEPGFQTPARVYGPDFVLGLRGTSRVDL